MAAESEVGIVKLRRAHPEWRPRMIGYHLENEEVRLVPSRSAIYRNLVRHRLSDPNARRNDVPICKRCERGQAMELLQTDALGESVYPSLVVRVESTIMSWRVGWPQGRGLAG